MPLSEASVSTLVFGIPFPFHADLDAKGHATLSRLWDSAFPELLLDQGVEARVKQLLPPGPVSQPSSTYRQYQCYEAALYALTGHLFDEPSVPLLSTGISDPAANATTGTQLGQIALPRCTRMSKDIIEGLGFEESDQIQRADLAVFLAGNRMAHMMALLGQYHGPAGQSGFLVFHKPGPYLPELRDRAS